MTFNEGAALTAAAVALVSTTAAVAQIVPLGGLELHENGRGLAYNGARPPVRFTGTLQADPGPGGLPSTLTFSFPGSPPFVPGDVEVFDRGVLDDVIRFNPSGAGGDPTYPESIVVYSFPIRGHYLPGDTPFPPYALYANTASVPEFNVLGEVSGSYEAAIYRPTIGQPGYLPGAPFGVNYRLSNDIPEPATWALMLLGAGVMGAGLRDRRAIVQAEPSSMKSTLSRR